MRDPRSRSSRRTRGAAVIAALAVLGGVLAAGPAPAPAAPATPSVRTGVADLTAPTTRAARPGARHTDWARVGKARITPGVQMYAKGGQCTANFVFTDARGGVYVGFAAHCAGTGGATDTDGCQAGSRPLGTKVTFAVGGNPLTSGTQVGTGRLAYSSWLTENEIGTTDRATCAYNDFALVKVDRRHVRKVNPSVPFWGGPTGIDTDGTRAGEPVYSYGNSSLRGGLSLLSPKVGASMGDAPADRGWSHPVYTLTPGIPGDSGSGFMDRRGRAVGTLSTLALAPLPLSNQLGDLNRELTFAKRHSGIKGLRLALGTKKFSPLP